MKYIAKYHSIVDTPTIESAKARHKKEYYRTPHGACNGARARSEFKKTKDGIFSIGQGSVNDTSQNGWGVETLVQDEWTKTMVSELINHLQQTQVEILAGYTAFVSKDGNKLLAESYTACSKNRVVIIHHDDGTSTLYVNSYRHGIPEMAFRYWDTEPVEVILYDSWRKDAKWWERGLESPEPRYPDWQEEAETLEEELMS